MFKRAHLESFLKCIQHFRNKNGTVHDYEKDKQKIRTFKPRAIFLLLGAEGGGGGGLFVVLYGISHIVILIFAILTVLSFVRKLSRAANFVACNASAHTGVNSFSYRACEMRARVFYMT